MKAILCYRDSRVGLLEEARVKKLDHVVQGVKQHVKNMFRGSFSFKGIGFLFPAKEMMNADKYIEVM